MDYSLLTPYRVPPRMAAYKIPNLGDGFILRAIERLLAPRRSVGCYSTRIAPGAAARKAMQQANTVVIAGANQLDDRYRIWPGFDAQQLREASWRFVPFGLGYNGEPNRNERMSELTRELLVAVHERIEYSSWRCPTTLRYLQRELPQLSDRFLMTGCPVLLDTPLLESARFHADESHVAVTSTERGDFWDRETRLLQTVARLWPKARRSFVVHQDFRRPSWIARLRSRDAPAVTDPARAFALREFAAKLGFEVVVPPGADEARYFYESVDLHVGSRLHAHLLLLSRNRRSWLLPIDGRALGMAEAFSYPLLDAQTIESSLENALGYDFEPLREQARAAHVTMQRFIASWAA